MKHLPAKVLMAVVLIAVGLISPAEAQERTPEAVLRDFYSWYLNAVSADRDPYAGNGAEMKQFVTARLFREIDKASKEEGGQGSDPFLSAQDFDKTWAKNMTVSKPVIDGDRATAGVTFKAPKWATHKLTVTLRQEGGAWKVDKVASK